MSNGNAQPVQLLVENRAEELIANGIFADVVATGLVRIRMCWESSSAISLAASYLLERPTVAVALALNCPFPSEQFRAPIERILNRAGPNGLWCVALAIPDMVAWLKMEQGFSRVLQQSRPAIGPKKADIAVFFKELSSQPDYQFDRQQVIDQDPEFARLAHFIEEHTKVKTGAH